MLAVCLSERGREVTIIEAAREPPCRSMAIGITPPSLDLLRAVGLDESFIRAGTPIRAVTVHERGRAVGRLSFESIEDRYPFILSLPQFETVRLLRARAAESGRICVIEGFAVERIEWEADRVRVVARDEARGAEIRLVAACATACDGARGDLAAKLGIEKRSHAYAPGFQMGDYLDRTGLGQAAHLYFGPERPVESFPLPGGKRRWIVRSSLRGRSDLAEPLHAAVQRLTGHVVFEADRVDESGFRPRRALARSFHRGRVALCGDAAHVMSPIGGQGMNTGFADAAFLAHAIHEALSGRGTFDAWMRRYRDERIRAYRVAARRAAAGMRLGVMRGELASFARGALISRLLSDRAAHDYLARWFMMRSLPRARAPVGIEAPVVAEPESRHAVG
jgi:2-polyprenyl-6-methoxyphenol hydroxylase-like FAD-dependent oxidoreductase